MKRIYFLALLFVLVIVNPNVAQITTETKFISKEDYRDKTLTMLKIGRASCRERV